MDGFDDLNIKKFMLVRAWTAWAIYDTRLVVHGIKIFSVDLLFLYLAA